MGLRHLATRLYGTPLLIHRLKLDTILGVLGSRIGLGGDIDLLVSDLPSITADDPVDAPGIALIPVHGTLVRRTGGLAVPSGLVSYDRVAADLAAALADPDIGAVLLDVDSCGGEAGGAFDLSDAIYRSRGQKPIWALANDECFSAAYAIASACDQVFVTRTGGVGSIGVIALHVDQSQADSQEGLTYTAVFAGARKNDLSPHLPLDRTAKSALQTEVDRLYALFIQTVARNRQCSADFVRQTEAAVFFGPDAVTAGLADGVTSLTDVLTQLSDLVLSPPNSACISSPSQEISMEKLSPETPVVEVTATASQSDPSGPAISPVSAQSSGPDYAQAVEVAQLCELAGMPNKTAEYLAAGYSVAQVRQTLLATKAAVPAISNHMISPTPSTQSDLLVKIVKQRTGKEN